MWWPWRGAIKPVERVVLVPASEPTVEVVGLFAYDFLLSPGTHEFELIPEPDNPYDQHAISVRHQNAVVGYIPRARTATYLPLISRITASRKIAVVQGTYRQGHIGHEDLFLNLLADDSAIPNGVTLVPKSDHYNVPNAYGLMVLPVAGQKSRSIKAKALYIVPLFVLMIGAGFCCRQVVLHQMKQKLL